MGIKGLNAIIAENVPHAIRKTEIKNFFGRKVAIDASMSLYQFLIAVRQQDGMNLSNSEGETTSHLMGMFYRTLRMIDNGIKPCYVFDGKPPVMKKFELDKRLDRRTETLSKMEEIKDNADLKEEYSKLQRRTVKVTKQQNDEAKKLLSLMGIPFVESPGEAEAQCAELAKGGKVYAAASEDMDTLCYKTPFLLRHLTFSEQRKEPINEIDVQKVLDGLELTIEEFIDLCIMLGCDYTNTIKGCGPVNALKLIKEHKSIEKIVEVIEDPEDSSTSKNWKVPENWDYKEARELFLHPDVTSAELIDLKWETPNEPELIKFMCEQNGFAEDRIKSGIERLKKGLKTGTQGRLDGFFKVVPKTKEQLQKLNAKNKKDSKAKGKITKKRR